MLITLPLYILREFSKAMALALLVFTFILLAVLAGQVLRDGFGIFTVMMILPKLFPLISPLTLPLTIITATLICYGRLSANNEFTAVQASGIHPLWTVVPSFLVAFLASIITVYLNSDVLTASVASIQRDLLNDRTEILRRRLARSGTFSFRVSDTEDWCIIRLPGNWDREGRAGIDITVFTRPVPPGSGAETETKYDIRYPYPKERFLAKDHRIDVIEAEDREHLYLDADLRHFTPLNLSAKEIPALTTERGYLRYAIKGDREVVISDERLTYRGIPRLQKDREETLREIREMRQAYERCVYHDPKETAMLKKRIRERMESLNKRTAELHLKLALSFSCIGFAAVGIPLGLRTRRGSASIGFAFGIAIAVAYYIVIKFLQSLVRDGIGEWWFLWIPNVVTLGVGVFLWLGRGRND